MIKNINVVLFLNKCLLLGQYIIECKRTVDAALRFICFCQVETNYKSNER